MSEVVVLTERPPTANTWVVAVFDSQEAARDYVHAHTPHDDFNPDLRESFVSHHNGYTLMTSTHEVKSSVAANSHASQKGN